VITAEFVVQHPAPCGLDIVAPLMAARCDLFIHLAQCPIARRRGRWSKNVDWSVQRDGGFQALGAHPLLLALEALCFMPAVSAGSCLDVCHPSEIPVPAVPAVLAEEVRFNPV
jgi:hypothetical protein